MTETGFPTSGNALGLTPELVRAYLVSVADALHRVVVPDLTGDALVRANDCVRVLSRLIVGDDETPDARLAISANMASRALAEGAAIERGNEATVQFRQSLRTRPSGTRTLDREDVEKCLRAHPRGGPLTQVIEARLLTGGRSKLTAFITQTGARDLPAEVVLRQDWTNSVVGSAVQMEFQVLQLLYSIGIKVPEPLVLRPADGDGNPFILVARAAGKTSGDTQQALPATQAPVLALAEQLGQIHAIDPELFRPMPGVVEKNYTLDQILAGIRDYGAVIQKHGPGSALIEGVLCWLTDNAPKVAARARALVHGDIGFHNSLCESEQLSVILDWELAHIGSAAYDLGYLRNAIVDDDLWAKFMIVYRAAGGPEVSPFEIDFFQLYSFIWFHHLVVQARAALAGGSLIDIDLATSCADIAPESMTRILPAYRRCLASGNAKDTFVHPS